MRELTVVDFKKFLSRYRIHWTGLVAENTNQEYEEYKKCDKFLSSLDDKYILLGDDYDWDEESGKVSVKDYRVRYIKQNLTTFNIYYKDNKGLNYLNLSQNLSDEWITYLVFNVDGYAESVLGVCKHIQEKTPKQIAERNGLLSKRIKELKAETNEANENDVFELNRSKQIEKLVKQLRPDISLKI